MESNTLHTVIDHYACENAIAQNNVRETELETFGQVSHAINTCPSLTDEDMEFLTEWVI